MSAITRYRSTAFRYLGVRLPAEVHSWHPVLFPLILGVVGSAVGTVMVAVALFYAITQRSFDLFTFFFGLLFIGVLLVLYRQLRWVYHLLGARYLLTNDSLILRTEDWRQTIPLRRIYRVVTGDSLPDHLVDGLTFGYRRGYGRVPGTGEAWFLTTTPSRDHLTMITTDAGNYVLSPADPGTLMRELAKRGVPLAPGRLPRSALSGHRIRLPFGYDRRAWFLLGLGILANLAMIALVAMRYSDLPPFLPLHYNAMGEVDFIGTPGEAFKLPGIAGGLLVGNIALATLVYRHERLAAYLFLAAGALVQAVMLVAAANLLR
ncbi:MAG: PH domain-containing protein [Chloroflexi bacterium]|nr:PH domain-containing protein [Chloroflexota bacterium]